MFMAHGSCKKFARTTYMSTIHPLQTDRWQRCQRRLQHSML